MNPLSWYGVVSAVVVAWVVAFYKVFMSSSDHSELVLPIITPETPPSATPTPIAPPQPVQSPTEPFTPMIVKWMQAIGIGEGANPALNNRGNLKYSTLTASWGAIKGPPASDGGYLCRFLTGHIGDIALMNFLKLGCEGQLIISHPQPCTLDAFTTRFAGNPPQGYKDNIAKYLGVPLSTDIATFIK